MLAGAQHNSEMVIHGTHEVIKLPPLLHSQLDVRECRLLLLAAAGIENRALGVEGQVGLRLEEELAAVLARIEKVLLPGDFKRVLIALTATPLLEMARFDETEN